MPVALPESLLRAHAWPQVLIVWLGLQGQASLSLMKPQQLPMYQWSLVEVQMSGLVSLAGSDKDVNE